MSLPESYLYATGRVPAYFDAILNAEPPERFSYKFLQNLGFTSSNDRLLIKVLKELGFLNTDGVPQERYYEYLDRSQSEYVLAQGIYETYSGLFTVNKKAYELGSDEVENKLRTLYAGDKSDHIIKRISKTFEALCDIADFSKIKQQNSVHIKSGNKDKEDAKKSEKAKSTSKTSQEKAGQKEHSQYTVDGAPSQSSVGVKSLQYHINIVLPSSRDQAVYNAIFKSMKEHLD